MDPNAMDPNVMDPNQHIKNKNKNIVFIPSGRLGNAIFRYMACVLLNISNPIMSSHTYTLQTDYKKPTSLFDFYKGIDCEGNDMAFINPSQHSLTTIEKHCEQNHYIMGFNTLGYIKDTITFNTMRDNQYINHNNGHGIYVKNTITITDENFMDFFYKINKLENVTILMDGYFQFGHLYLKYKKEIVDYMEKHKNEHKIQTDRNEIYLIKELLNDIILPANKQYDVVIHLRLGDFNGRPDFIELKYYLKLFESLPITKNQHIRICLLHEPIHTIDDQQFIEHCVVWFQERGLNIGIESNSLLIDFNIMKQCKLLVCSMSTLSWTAAYLSTHLKLCYMPNYNFFKGVGLDANTTAHFDRSNFYFSLPIENTILYDVSTTLPKISNIKSVVLTLPEYSSRLMNLDKLIQNLEKIGVRTEVFNGVYGKDIVIKYDNQMEVETITWRDETYNYNENLRLNGKRMMPGEFGCVWSHINIFKELVKLDKDRNDINNRNNRNDNMYYLVLEDDVQLVKPLNELQDLLFHIPEDMDFCHLALSDWYPFALTHPKNEYFYECKKQFFNRTTAYIVSRKGAKKILDYLGNEINLPIDDLINTIYRTQPDFKFYVPKTYFFKEQDNTTSSIATL